jgi:threonine/homoserine/homoserine lactone efflux protein
LTPDSLRKGSINYLTQDIALTGHLITISIIGLLAGFFFSMPIAGPISILITSNALKGRLKYCNLLAVGSAVADFIYVLIAVYGITHLFSVYKGVIPYILGAGALFVFYVGYRIVRTKFDPEHIDEEQRLADKQDNKHKGAIYTGFMLNFLNPTLFFGWMISSFIMLSFAASLGFDTGGLSTSVDQSLDQMGKIDGGITEKPKIPTYLQFDTLKMMKKENRIERHVKVTHYNHLTTSLFYAIFLAVGSVLWFFLLTVTLVKFRKRININVLNWFVRAMGIMLCLFALFFGYTAVKMLL